MMPLKNASSSYCQKLTTSGPSILVLIDTQGVDTGAGSKEAETAVAEAGPKQFLSVPSQMM